MICTECGHELVKVATPLEEELKGEKFVINDIERYECPKCGSYELNLNMADKLNTAIWEQYCKKHGILGPEQIKKIRTELGVTQRELQQMLCVSHPTVSRWETGTFVPSLQSSREMEALRDCPPFASYLMSKAEIHPKSKNSYQKTIKFKVHDGFKRSQNDFNQIDLTLNKG